MSKQITALQITTNYPCVENPIYGIFMKEQVESLEPLGVRNKIVFSNGLRSNLRVKNGATFIHLRTALKLWWHLRFNKYDVIHCHNVHAGLILKVAMGFSRAKGTVISLQIDPETPGSNDAKFFSMLQAKFSRLIVKKPLKTVREKVMYLPNGVNMDLFRPMERQECKRRLGLDPGKRYILFVDSNTSKGRTQKRFDRFNDVLDILKSRYGHTDVEPLVMTRTQREDVPVWMNACDMYLLTSDEEGSPNAVKECMSCNVPVVATNVGNIPDLFAGVEECKMARTFDAQELACLAHEVLENGRPECLREKIKEKHLDMHSIALRLYGLYEEISNK